MDFRLLSLFNFPPADVDKLIKANLAHGAQPMADFWQAKRSNYVNSRGFVVFLHRAEGLEAEAVTTNHEQG